MTTRYATRPGRPSINSSSRHSTRNIGDGSSNSYQRRFRDEDITTEAEESSTSSSFPLWKTIGVVAVVIGCFAAVYPKMFHPMLLYALGYGQTQKPDEGEIYQHPSIKHGSGQPNFAGPTPGNARQPHPGSRMGPMPGMGAGMHPTPDGGRGGGKSMWHWMLPFYTVGVIVFLLYTLSKIMWKKQPKKESATRRRLNMRYNSERDRFESGDPDIDEDVDLDEDEEEHGGLNGSVLDNRQLRGLQHRLQDTERTMHEILSQLEQLSTTADPAAAEQIKKMTMETLNSLGRMDGDRRSRSSRAAGGNVGFSNSQDGRLHFEPNERRYLHDLQKALAEFKQFTESYIEDHSQRLQQEKKDDQPNQESPVEKKETENITDEAVSDQQDDGIDVMEAEKSCNVEELKVEDGEGELIPLRETTPAPSTSGRNLAAAEKEEPVSTPSDHNGNESERSPGESLPQGKKHVRQRKGRKHVRHDN